jgi:hypothetical protein
MMMIELLISSLIASMLLLGLTGALVLPVRIYHVTDDLNYASSKAETVFSILRHPAELCGYGLPKNASGYKSAFGINKDPFKWDGPVSIGAVTAGSPKGKRENASLKIAYAVRYFVRTMDEAVISPGVSELKVSGKPSAIGYEDENTGPAVTDWLLFGSMLPCLRPLSIRGRPAENPDGTVNLPVIFSPDEANERLVIPENEELYGFRVMECRAQKTETDFVFFTNDHTGSGLQPRVDGVVDVRFELREGRLLDVYVLTRGRRRYDRAVSLNTPRGWPEKYAQTIPEEARYYRLTASRASFELKNF